MSDTPIGFEAIAEIERVLSVILPDDYKQFLFASPAEPLDDQSEPWSDVEVLGTPESIIEVNQIVREDGFAGHPWPRDYLIVGDDNSTGDAYFLDLSRDRSPVFVARYHESSSAGSLHVREAAPDMSAWVRPIREEEAVARKPVRVHRALNRFTCWHYWMVRVLAGLAGVAGLLVSAACVGFAVWSARSSHQRNVAVVIFLIIFGFTVYWLWVASRVFSLRVIEGRLRSAHHDESPPYWNVQPYTTLSINGRSYRFVWGRALAEALKGKKGLPVRITADKRGFVARVEW